MMEVDSTASSATAGTNSNVSDSTSANATVALPPTRQLLYELIIRQLHDDGFASLSSSLASETGLRLDLSFPPSQLNALVESALRSVQIKEFQKRSAMQLGRENGVYTSANDESNAKVATDSTEMKEADESSEFEPVSESEKAILASSGAPLYSVLGASPHLLDLTQNPSLSKLSTPFAPYSERATSSFKAAVSALAMSADGAFLAAGAHDTTIKLLDVSNMKIISLPQPSAAPTGTSRIPQKRDAASKQLVSNWMDHSQAVTALAFHPFEPLVLSGSADQSLKFFNYTQALDMAAKGLTLDSLSDNARSLARRCYKTMGLENSTINALHFHPSGDYALVATQQNFVRLYDVQTFKAYTSGDFACFHGGPVTAARFSRDGKMYVTTSVDGKIKVWDGVTHQMTDEVLAAHDGSEICSLDFAPSGKYFVTAGRDSTVRLWDVSQLKKGPLQTYKGAQFRSPYYGGGGNISAVFEHSGEWILAGDESRPIVNVWDTRSGELVKRLESHQRTVRTLVASPTEGVFATGSDDFTAKLWCSSSN